MKAREIAFRVFESEHAGKAFRVFAPNDIQDAFDTEYPLLFPPEDAVIDGDAEEDEGEGA